MDTSVNEQHLRFRWNDHMQHISKILSVQRQEEQFCDCTLVSDDGFILKAHQAILASTSAYFLRVLAQVSPEQHPIIVLRGANFREMSCLLDYMYQGNTQIEQSLMESILEVADMLDVKGLSRIRSNTCMDKLVNPLYISTPTTPASPVTSATAPPTTVSAPDTQRSIVRPENDCNTSTNINESLIDCSDVLSWNRQKQSSLHNEPTNGQSSISLNEDHGNINACETAEQQISGIDLTLAKHEPSSPKDSLSCAKRRNTYRETSLPPKIVHEVKGILKDKISSINITSYSSKNIDGNVASVRQENIISTSKEMLSFASSVTPTTVSTTCSTLTSSLISNKDENMETELNTAKRIPIKGSLEIPCQDGPFTISLTTGQRENEKPYSSVFKRKSLFCRSIALKRAKRKHRAKKILEESKRKWLAKERRALFGEADSQVAERPITRALERLKSKGGNSAENVHLNCDSFPLKDTNILQDINNQENTKTQQKETVIENISRVATPAKQIHFRNNKESGCNWDFNDGRLTSDEKNKDSAQGNLKYPAINPLSLFTLPPVKEKEKQTRTTLTLEEKVKVIEAFLDGKSQRQIAHIYGIGKTQVSGIIKRREEILTIYRDSLLRGEKLTMKRQRKSEYALLNQHLIQWYRHMTVVAGVKITTGMLRAKALQIAPELGYNDFKASNGWLATFKANNNLKFSKQRKPDSFDDQMSSYQHHEIQQRDEESFFEEGEGEDSSSSNMASMKTLGGPSNLNSQGNNGGNNQEHGNNNSQLSATERLGTTGSGNSTDTVAPTDMSSSLVSHPGLAIGVAKASHHQMANHGSLGPANLTAAAAYNLSRDLTRDLARGVTGGGESSSSVADLTSSAAAAMNASSLNHPMTAALNVSRAVIDNQLSKPGESALAAYKSEEPLAPYGYGDHQNRMNDHSSRGAEYNYTPYGFPGGYYGYHFLGQY